MEPDTEIKRFIRTIGSDRRRRRQFAVVGAALLAWGCASDEDANLGQIGIVEGFLGGVAADEPRAALIGRDILSAGGTAADAATAVYFALSVTLPSSASLGGGGVCLVHDAASGRTESLRFLARRPAAVPRATARPNAVPGNPRGFFALHSKYGFLRWAQLVAPAENLARFGTPVSRALARDLDQVGDALLAEPGNRALFGRADGRGVLREGDFMSQVGLAAQLSRMRSLGPGDFYVGRSAHGLIDAVTQAGGWLSSEDLRSFAPAWGDTVTVPFGNETAHFAPPPAAAGSVAAQMWALLTRDDGYDDSGDDERPHLFVEAALRAFADRGQWMNDDGTSRVVPGDLISEARLDALMATYRSDRHVPAAQLNPAPVPRLENPAATSFVVLDRHGSAVACALTMNNLFGNGRVAPGTGILLAMPPGQGGRGPVSLGPMIVVNEHVNEFYFAAAATGGVAAPTALMGVAAAALVGKKSLEGAIQAPRLHHGGAPDLVYFEQGYDRDRLAALTGRGHRIGATKILGRVNAAFCSAGLPPNPETCTVRTDQRGFGLAASAD
ncbi:MAG: gamma-glutamyltransferase [Rhodospirillales bacterium]|nr:gamma-glutamyltransferase [Rhodospirillales bacterium]